MTPRGAGEDQPGLSRPTGDHSPFLNPVTHRVMQPKSLQTDDPLAIADHDSNPNPEDPLVLANHWLGVTMSSNFLLGIFYWIK